MTRLIPALAAALALPLAALAVTDGDLSEGSSEATMEIKLVVTNEPNILITGFENVAFDFNRYEGIPAEVTQDICVHMQQPGQYSIRIVADPLNDGAIDFPYTYKYTDGGNTNLVLQQTISDTQGDDNLAGFTPSSSPDCSSGGDAATFSLVLAEAPTTATQQTAEATIIMTVTPS